MLVVGGVVAMALARGPYVTAAPAAASAATPSALPSEEPRVTRSATSTAVVVVPVVSSSPAAKPSAASAAAQGEEDEEDEDEATIEIPGPEASTRPPATADALAALADFVDRRQKGDNPGALSALEKLAEADREAFADKKLQDQIVDLSQSVCRNPGPDNDRFFELLTKKTGTHGLDIMFTLVSTKGGSAAAATAQTLLAQPDTAARGTPAMRIAFDLHRASCNAKIPLFERAGKDGDRRAYAQLKQIDHSCGQSRRGRRKRRVMVGCCLAGNPQLGAAIAAMNARGVK